MEREAAGCLQLRSAGRGGPRDRGLEMGKLFPLGRRRTKQRCERVLGSLVSLSVWPTWHWLDFALCIIRIFQVFLNSAGSSPKTPTNKQRLFCPSVCVEVVRAPSLLSSECAPHFLVAIHGLSAANASVGLLWNSWEKSARARISYLLYTHMIPGISYVCTHLDSFMMP